METGRFKVMVNMSSDHAGIAKELNELEREIYGVIAHIDDARVLRDYIAYLRQESREFCDARQIDMRGWMERTRKDRPREPWEQTKARWNERQK